MPYHLDGFRLCYRLKESSVRIPVFIHGRNVYTNKLIWNFNSVTVIQPGSCD